MHLVLQRVIGCNLHISFLWVIRYGIYTTAIKSDISLEDNIHFAAAIAHEKITQFITNSYEVA